MKIQTNPSNLPKTTEFTRIFRHMRRSGITPKQLWNLWFEYLQRFRVSELPASEQWFLEMAALDLKHFPRK